MSKGADFKKVGYDATGWIKSFTRLCTGHSCFLIQAHDSLDDS